jgi:hypothetical protein
VVDHWVASRISRLQLDFSTGLKTAKETAHGESVLTLLGFIIVSNVEVSVLLAAGEIEELTLAVRHSR